MNQKRNTNFAGYFHSLHVIALLICGCLVSFGCRTWQSGSPLSSALSGSSTGQSVLPPPPRNFGGPDDSGSTTRGGSIYADSSFGGSSSSGSSNRQAVAPQEQPYTVRYQSPSSGGQLPPNNNILPIDSIYAEVENASRGSGVRDAANLVADVVITGNQLLETHHILRNISTRPGRYFDPDRLQQDVDRLYRLPEIRRIKGPYIDRSESGIVVTMEIIERNRVREVKFIGNRGITDRALAKETDLNDGAPLDVHQIRMTKTRIEDFYKDKGYPRTQVEILEGDEPEDADVVFLIHEDQKQRIWNAEFEGNTFATDARLRTFIQSKPGVAKVFGGLAKRDEIEQDVTRLTNYYRKFGYFNARIGREISESNDGRWLTVRFIINEGPRYRIRNVTFIGNSAYAPDQLMKIVKLCPDETGSHPEFNAGMMNEDVVSLRDLYGSEGFVYSDVQAEPRFLEEPGMLDLVYKITEGEQYRVGRINVHINGGITKRQVALNRLSLRPGDKIDVRKVRESERLLGNANIFAGGQPGGSGQAPRIVVRPMDDSEFDRTARAPVTRSRGSGSRPAAGSGSGSRPAAGSSRR